MAQDRERRAERRHSEEAARSWANLLLERLRAAASPAEREQILHEMDRPYLLDEDSALAVYRMAPRASSEFIGRHAPLGRRAADARLPWTRLMHEAMGQGDEALYFVLYRAQVPAEQWARETQELARRIANPELLCAELDRRHPRRWRADIGPHLYALAQQRGEHMLPYLRDHSARVWSPKRRAAAKEMAELARVRGWWDLWGKLTGLCAKASEYDALVAALAEDTSTPELQVRQQLLQLAGGPDSDTTRLRLKDSTLLALYRRFPHYASGPFRAQLAVSVKQPRTAVLKQAMAQRDDDIIDLLATQLAGYEPRSGDAALIETARLAATYYAQLGPPDAALGARIVRILKRIPSGAIRAPGDLERDNPLAELLFGIARAAAMTDPDLLRELLGARCRHIVSLALQAVGEPGNSVQVDADVDVLLGLLMRPFDRPGLRGVLRALQGVSSEAAARRVLEALRERLSHAERRVSVDALASLAGTLLQRFPQLRTAGEQPVVYRRAV